MENNKDTEIPLNEMWKHVGTHELKKLFEAYPIHEWRITLIGKRLRC